MATNTWPTTLPQCPNLEFTEQRQRNVVAFVPDVGPPKVRRRSTAVGVQTAVAFRMTNAQVLAFDTFYETTLKDGSLPFDWPHPVTKVTYTWMFSASEAPRKSRVTTRTYNVDFTLLRLPQ